MLKNFLHKSVLLNEAVEELNINSDGIYIDGTFGQGGHSRLILSKLNSRGKLFAIDRDPAVIKTANSIQDERFNFIHGPFSSIEKYMETLDLKGKINGVLLDLGISSQQINNPKRGFSFMHDGPLDMRMDNTSGISAAEWLNRAQTDEIASVLKNFGEERFAKRISQAIVTQKRKKYITSTIELSKLISKSIPFRDKHKHPATRSFQAIRIYINRELEEIEKALKGILSILSPGGRMSIISFHSLEDKLVKKFIVNHSHGIQFPVGLPLTEDQIHSYSSNRRHLLKAISKIRSSEREIHDNPRARSSILRSAEKLLP